MAEIQKSTHRGYASVSEKLRVWSEAAQNRWTPEEREANQKRNRELELHFITCNMYAAMILNRMIDELDTPLTGGALDWAREERDRALTNAQYGRNARFITGDAIWDEPYRNSLT